MGAPPSEKVRGFSLEFADLFPEKAQRVSKRVSKQEKEAALVGAIAMAKEAVVARPEFPTKKQKDSINRGGCEGG